LNCSRIVFLWSFVLLLGNTPILPLLVNRRFNALFEDTVLSYTYAYSLSKYMVTCIMLLFGSKQKNQTILSALMCQMILVRFAVNMAWNLFIY
jgi:hypothetical protein